MDNDCFDLVADLDSLFGLDVGIAGEVFQRNVRGVLRAQVDFDLGRANGHNRTGYLISIIQSLEGLLEKLGKILLHCSFNFHFFAHFVVYLLNYPRRRRCACRNPHSICAGKKAHLQIICLIDQ